MNLRSKACSVLGFWLIAHGSACGEGPSSSAGSESKAPGTLRDSEPSDRADGGSDPSTDDTAAQHPLAASLKTLEEKREGVSYRGICVYGNTLPEVHLHFSPTGPIAILDSYIEYATTFFSKVDAFVGDAGVPEALLTSQKHSQLRTELNLFRSLQSILKEAPLHVFTADEIRTDGDALRKKLEALTGPHDIRIAALSRLATYLTYDRHHLLKRFRDSVYKEVRPARVTLTAYGDLPAVEEVETAIAQKKRELLATIADLRSECQTVLAKYDHFPILFQTEEMSTIMITGTTDTRARASSLIRKFNLKSDEIALNIEGVRLVLPFADALKADVAAIGVDLLTERQIVAAWNTRGGAPP